MASGGHPLKSQPPAVSAARRRGDLHLQAVRQGQGHDRALQGLLWRQPHEGLPVTGAAHRWRRRRCRGGAFIPGRPLAPIERFVGRGPAQQMVEVGLEAGESCGEGIDIGVPSPISRLPGRGSDSTA
jgi:hypothetical protein